jgi:GNAT superfamily N-acetyltransferase
MKIIKFRKEYREKIHEILKTTGFFSYEEINVALELLDDYLNNPNSTYSIYVAVDEINQEDVIGYVCFGKTPLSYSTYELYWIAVTPHSQGKGIGKELMHFFEQKVKENAGLNILIETSSKTIYEPTRKFYEALGYKVLCVVKDFYAPGDDRITYVKRLGEESGEGEKLRR